MRWPVTFLIGSFCCALITACDRFEYRQQAREPSPTSQARQVSFNDVAPIIWEKCAYCHRPGEAAPFPFLSYQDVKKRRAQMLEVIRSGYMPPWLPDPLHGVAYENDTQLNAAQLNILTHWLENGAPEGLPETLPPQPVWPQGWQLGPPDLVVSMPRAFELPADGQDIYRNFVIPIPTERLRYVRAMEFRPDNYRIVHHAFILVDPTGGLRRIRAADGQPGFGGMDAKEAISPEGHFIGWQPGRRPYEAPQGMAWRLHPHTDLVLQVHMQSTGKPETFRASVGLFFTEEVPQRSPTKLVLLSETIDIPPGVSDYEIEDRLELPVDIEVMAVAPHAHYLAKEMYAFAELPDGTVKPLLTIKNWDLNWQSEYRFKDWIRLPAGTILRQRYIYDNSVNNIRNPNAPPQRVTFGPEATDEMGSLWIQVITDGAAERAKLNDALVVKTLKQMIARNRRILVSNPRDVDAHVQLGKAALITGRAETAVRYFEKAAEADPAAADPLYFWGHTLLRTGNPEAGVEKLHACLQRDADYYKAHHDLGQAAFLAKDYSVAEQHFRNALQLHAYSAPTLLQLGRSLLRQGKKEEGIEFLTKSLAVAPNDNIQRQVEALERSLSNGS